MISFSLTELRMPSLRAVYEMTLSEYFLRVEGYKREQIRQMVRDRRTWYTSLTGSHWDPKKLPKTEEAYIPIPEVDKAPEMTNDMKDMWKEAVERYKKERAEADGSTNN